MAAVPLASSTGRVAVLADDDLEMRGLMEAVLRDAGLTVVAVPDGLALVDYLLHAPRPALVVTDLQMPGATGLRVIRHVRRMGLDVPVLLVTAFGNPRVHAEALRLGATAVLDKPFSIDALRTLALRLLESSEEPSRVHGPDAPVAPGAQPPKGERDVG